jgi:metal transporter CNNM
MISFLTLFAGAMSGLTVGYLSIDDLVLELKSKTGTNLEKKYSEKILPIICQRHWLLVTLLICNASAMEALPIYLNKLVDEYMAIMISVTLVLFFGEIIPQALCTGPNQLQIAYFLAPLTKLLMYVTFVISYPIALILDYLLGKHSKSRFVNTDLKGLIELHTMEALAKIAREEGHILLPNKEEIGLHNEQKDLMISAIEIKERKVIEIMIPISKVFMIDYDQEIDRMQLNLILDKGYSRIPVYHKDRNNIIGLLRIKQLIGIDISQNKSIRNIGLKLSPPIIVHPTTPALEALGEFKKGKSHMAFVTEQVKEYQKRFGLDEANSYVDSNNIMKNNLKSNHIKSKILGIITLEDILERMINIDILDEDDYRKTKTLHHKSGTNSKTKFYSK